jgi:ABC-2 type transport system ATP-binding protein
MNDPSEISVAELSKRYRASGTDMLALDGVSFAVRKGEILGLLGANGAGKSTLVRILSTLLRFDSGTASIAGHDLRREADAVRRSIGVAQQEVGLDESRRVCGILDLHARLYGLSRRDREQRIGELIEVLCLQEVADRRIRNLSGGTRRKVDLALALVHEPPIIFLDEPTLGMDPPSRLEFWERIRSLREGGATILLTTQHLEEADHLADRVIILFEGRVVAEGSPRELKRSVGESTLELDFANPADAIRGASSLGQASRQSGNSVRLPISDPDDLRVALEKLDADAIRPIAVRVEEPSLDQLFLRRHQSVRAPAELSR